MLLDYYQALQSLLTDLSHNSVVEECSLLEATHRVLAEDIRVQYDTPLFDNSAMDGYALGGDLENCQQWLVIDRIAAGETAEKVTLTTGQAVRIFTGAPVPKGTTAVVQQEHAQLENNMLTLTQPVRGGSNIRYQGEELAKGDVLLPAKKQLTPVAIALLASQGYSKVKVFKPLTIYVFSTGNELVEPNQALTTGKIFDANRYLLLSWLQGSVHRIIDGGILPDSQALTEQALAKASQQADVIITSGGVSVGEEDHVRAAIEQLGKLVFWKLAIKPGKPFAWGAINHTKLFMLPGNPVGSLVTFQQLVIPALRVLEGQTIDKAVPASVMAQADFAINKTQTRREFLRVNLKSDAAGFRAELLANQGSAMLSTCVVAQALAEIPAGTIVNKNDLLKIYLLDYKV